MFGRFLKYSLVGALGVIVNEGVLLLLRDYLPLTVGLALAIEFSILSNFILNDIWTFRDSRVGSIGGRLLRFHVSSLVGGAVQYVIVIGLVILFVNYSNLTELLFLLFFSSLKLSSIYLAAINFIGIVGGFGVRFILSLKYVWG
ncbi:GtrA family protein [Sulfolobus acidocaldarius]|uniref:Conserved Archaeal GtrA-like protein n=4 Tax=Sulfolobus acidocaldarius TaxID=2285 RepID=Q4JBG5_SULAC|nr:GtrA family protein [Sulfolobus acidocaldarius]AAY79864.1 conserved Archaeal GtrA-like protein [Sulfolobus acidocaldarius DSM 639]AGE70426.1 GtrA-like protein [Sulfolobus acidocaldarius N8]AGE72700.1 GtrA-like protein [Sulfolobus acidocaldarius Ron12/I]ALU29188.1 sugar translocase [Sulfolobus acidocaldarius]ALU31915.1 sugar translocase [Sulfolobus acidocaldarius]